ncbi:hypothetical protein AB205_0013030 [Aquarana catesbeiana]|uniref:PLA2c domain-containing protein n=1 Tax=Aquarana catesbeiana TaxID=8400 RepID=A0A2G9SEV2_AQUCT|nr:hypothetical protein AB205_0013030 [Aquarana catesbeiana]
MSTPTKCPDITCCSSSQSEGEKLSVQARKRIIAKNLLSQGMHSAENFDPPVIAVLGSGGGLRAMNAFLGILSKLSELKLLDVVTYVSGTSGSTWCMASLYNNEKWSDFSCMEEMESQIYDRLQSTWNWDKSWEKLEKAFLEEVFSLTDLWAYVVVYWMTNEIHERNLSNHKVVCENGVNPYPVYSAIEKEEGTWFEFTPHMCGFPAYKCFVKTEFLGSKFEAGRLLKKQPEKDLSYLNGLWGSALSSDNLIREITERFWGSAPSNNYLFHDFIKRTSEEPNPILEQKTKFARGCSCEAPGYITSASLKQKVGEKISFKGQVHRYRKKYSTHIFLQKKMSIYEYFYCRSLENIAPMIIGSRLHCQAPADMLSTHTPVFLFENVRKSDSRCGKKDPRPLSQGAEGAGACYMFHPKYGWNI